MAQPVAVAILVSALTAAACTAGAQELPPRLDSNVLVRVELHARPAVEGRLLHSWSPAAPALLVCRRLTARCSSQLDTAIAWLDSTEVRAIYRARGTQARRGALIGAGVGLVASFFVAALVSATTCADCPSPPRARAPIVVSATTLLGAIVGLGVGAVHPRWQPVLPRVVPSN